MWHKTELEKGKYELFASTFSELKEKIQELRDNLFNEGQTLDFTLGARPCKGGFCIELKEMPIQGFRRKITRYSMIRRLYENIPTLRRTESYLCSRCGRDVEVYSD